MTMKDETKAAENCRRRHTNLNMAWIDYKKAYDMVSHSWILESVTLAGIAENIKRLLKNCMDNWKTELNAYETMLGEVNIRQGIFLSLIHISEPTRPY